MRKPISQAARQAARRARGKHVSLVITEKPAISELELLSKFHGGPKPAITHLLISNRKRRNAKCT